jgi:hypothetical protein
MHSEHGPVGDRRILVNALRAARAEIAALTEQRDRAVRELDEMIAAYDNSMMLALTYHGQRDRD